MQNCFEVFTKVTNIANYSSSVPALGNWQLVCALVLARFFKSLLRISSRNQKTETQTWRSFGSTASQARMPSEGGPGELRLFVVDRSHSRMKSTTESSSVSESKNKFKHDCWTNALLAQSAMLPCWCPHAALWLGFEHLFQQWDWDTNLVSWHVLLVQFGLLLQYNWKCDSAP